MFGKAGVDGAAAATRASAPGFGGFGDIFDAFFGGSAGGGRRTRPGEHRLGPALRPPDHLRRGGPGDGEGDRVPGPRPLRDVRRQRRQAGHERHDLPAVQRPRRGPQRPPDDARPDGQRPAPARAATARAGSSRRRARRATATAGSSARKKLRVTSRPGSTRATRSGCRARARPGRAAGRPGSLYVAVHVQRPPDAQARGHRAVPTSARSRSPRPPSGPASRSRRSRATSEVEIKPGHPARGPRSGCAARACPHLRRASVARRPPRASSRSTVPTKLTKKQRELLEAYAADVGRGGRPAGHGGILDRVKDALG